MKQKNTNTDNSVHNQEKTCKCCLGNQCINRRLLFGSIILIVGFGLLLHNMFGWSFNYFWPLTIILIGLYIIFRRKNE